MTEAAAKVKTGGPDDGLDKWLEHTAGWALVVVLAMLVTNLGWM